MNSDLNDSIRQGDRQQDAELMSRVSKGDTTALESFYTSYFQRLYRYVFYRVGRDHHHTEEVVNDTFIEAIEKAKNYDATRGSIDSWLITISRNIIRSLKTTIGRAREYEKSWTTIDGDLEGLFADMSRNALPESELESEELKILVGTALSGLPEGYAELLIMKYVQNLSVRDIAVNLNRTEKAVESQLTRARLAFRESFNQLNH